MGSEELKIDERSKYIVECIIADTKRDVMDEEDIEHYTECVDDLIQEHLTAAKERIAEMRGTLESVKAGLSDPEIWIRNPKAPKRIKNAIRMIDDRLS